MPLDYCRGSQYENGGKFHGYLKPESPGHCPLSSFRGSVNLSADVVLALFVPKLSVMQS